MNHEKLVQIYRAKHELWLKYLFSSFAISNENIKNKLQDMANIEFRHLKWLSNKLKEEGIKYDYERNHLNIKLDTAFLYYEYLINQTKMVMKHYEEDVLFARIISDEYYFISTLESLFEDTSNDEDILAFNMDRKYLDKNLDEISTDALTLFLFEETYKEYELILIYAYMQNYTDNITLYNVYQDLIDESLFHLKCFGNMLAIMGILAIPRVVLKQFYQRDDIKQFLLDGIDEEKLAKEECRKLAEAVRDDELSKFFDFINYQENYHIELMQKAVKEL